MAVFNPAMMEQDAGAGMDNMGTEDLALPFLKVLSGNDPVLDENETARKGDIYNTVTGIPYKGKDGVRVVPLRLSASVYPVGSAWQRKRCAHGNL